MATPPWLAALAGWLSWIALVGSVLVAGVCRRQDRPLILASIAVAVLSVLAFDHHAWIENCFKHGGQLSFVRWECDLPPVL